MPKITGKSPESTCSEQPETDLSKSPVSDEDLISLMKTGPFSEPLKPGFGGARTDRFDA